MKQNNFTLMFLFILFWPSVGSAADSLADSISENTEVESLRVAVASNFVPTLKFIATYYESETGHRITIIPGSTGRLYAQIVNGAPFDIFLSADSERAMLLEDNGQSVTGSLFTYAIGRLVLWSPDEKVRIDNGNILTQGNFQRLALANPGLAPYGRAAKEVLSNLNLWEQLQAKLVRGQNVVQTQQFIQTANAQLGFIAYSQLSGLNRNRQGSIIGGEDSEKRFWEIPPHLYSPLEQQAVILKDSAQAQDFFRFLKSPTMLTLIQNSGYNTP